MKIFILLVAVVLASAVMTVDALAIGKREKGALLGAGALLLLPTLGQNMGNLFGAGEPVVVHSATPREREVVYVERPVYRAPHQEYYQRMPSREYHRGGAYGEPLYEEPYRRKTIIIER